MLTQGEKFGHYEIEAVLGRGAMGTVYKANDTRLDRTVALKLINEDLSQSPKYRMRLAEEARKAAQLDSPFVVKVWEYAELNDQPYISLEYVPGETLRTVLPTLKIEQRVDLSIKIARGISAAHGKGIIHRDLKPENIKVTSEGDAKILDFGLALAAAPGDSVDASGNIEGTVLYASPEQLSGEPATVVSDLFSYGIILYELFTGQLPFEGTYAAATIYSILYEEPDSPSEINDELPDWLNDLIIKLLQKNPSERFQDTNEIIRHFEQNIKGNGDAPSIFVSKKNKTLTVVDLKNLSGDESWTYFCQGFTEDVINELNHRTELIISAQPDTSLPRDIKEVFNRCRTDFVLTGSLMKWQEQIRLSITIYGHGGDELISNKKYEGSGEELFRLLSSAATDGAEVLADVTGSSAKDIITTQTPNVSAYDFYLKGRSYYQTNKPEDLTFAEEMFQRAVAIDPNLALAYTGLADVYAFQYMAFYDRSAQKIAAAKKEAEKAIAINPNLPEAHRSLGRYYMFIDEPEEAEQAFMKAIYHNPKYAIGYRTLAWLKLSTSKLEDAMRWARKALELAQTDLETLLLLSLIHMDTRKYTLALATLQRAVELGPDYGRAYYSLGDVYMKLGVPDLALENFLLAIKYQGDPNCFIDAGYVYLLQKDYDTAKEMFKQSIEQGQLTFVALYYLGLAEHLAGNADEAMRQFDRTLEHIRAQDESEEHNDHLLGIKALTHAQRREDAAAKEILEQLSSKQALNGEVLYSVARAYAVLGEIDNSRRFLHQSLQRHDGPTEKETRLDPHFHAILD